MQDAQGAIVNPTFFFGGDGLGTIAGEGHDQVAHPDDR
jgi:hypothetical protein